MKKMQYPVVSFVLRMGVVAAALMSVLCLAALVRGNGSALAALGLFFMSLGATVGANNLERRIARIQRHAARAQLRVTKGGKLPVRVA